jgi:FMN phosphatase YigB (HAD superfamily)
MKRINIDEIKLVSWDVDGTLYSLRRMKWHVLTKYLKETICGNRALAHQQLTAWRRYRQMIDRARVEGGTLAGNLRDGAERRSLETTARRWYGQAISKAGPRSGVERVLVRLRDLGIPQVVFSDFQSDAKLEILRLSEYFDSVYIGEHLGFVKPHPAVLKKIATDFSVPIESVLHIGDRADRDDAAARAAGCRCLILGRDFRNFTSLLNQLPL